jgi:phosphatidylserine/phosphatidylglycerophosphate/cardiolipin synthase-like enzyme
MKTHTTLLITTIAALVLSGCAEAQQSNSSAKEESFISIDDRDKFSVIYNDPFSYSKPMMSTDSRIGEALIKEINKSTVSIDFAIYGLRNQDEVINALKAAQERGVQVRGVVDMNVDGLNYYSDTPNLIDEIKSVKSDYKADLKKRDEGEIYSNPFWSAPVGFKGAVSCVGYSLPNNRAIISAQASREKIIFQGDIMHNKFFIFDRLTVWTGSCNISDSGTGGYNANVACLIRSTNIANCYTEEFEQMYISERYHKTKKVLVKSTNTVLANGTKVALYFSPQDKAADKAIRPLLQAARETIDVAVFFLTHKTITGDLIDAHQRGVKVRVLLDATGAKNEYTKLQFLREAGIPVKIENWGGKMHMKSAVIDNHHLILGSMNWTSAGNYSNDENTIIITSKTLSSEFSGFYQELWSSIPEKWLSGRPDPESKESGTSWKDGVDNDFDGKIDSDDPGCSVIPPPLPDLPPYKIVPKQEGQMLIKGNINSKGKKYYFVPTNSFYNRTKINVRYGERWFPSIEEAKQSGWRRPPGK